MTDEIEKIAQKIFHAQYPGDDFSSLSIYQREVRRFFAKWHLEKTAQLRAEIEKLQAAIAIKDEALNQIALCEQERLRAQMSGMPTGLEHPNTHAMFKRALFAAREALSSTAGNELLKKAQQTLTWPQPKE